jgi:drug/metabolite transporter (DMT)-like permease
MVAFGYVVFGQLPDAWTIAGSTVIIGSGIYLIHRERVTKTPVQPIDPL